MPQVSLFQVIWFSDSEAGLSWETLMSSSGRQEEMKATRWKKKRGIFFLHCWIIFPQGSAKSVLNTKCAIDGSAIANSVVITQQDKKANRLPMCLK